MWVAEAGQRVEVRGQGGDERLALAGGHLGDRALVQDHPAHELHVEVAHAHRAPGRLPDSGEGLGQEVVDLRAVGQALPELVSPRAELGVGERLHARARAH